MSQRHNALLQFNYIPYPLWRRRLPAPVKLLADPLLQRVYPVAEDADPPQTVARMAAYLDRFGLVAGCDLPGITAALTASPAGDIPVLHDDSPTVTPQTPLRLPAQWEALEAVFLNWPVLYPPLWKQYAQMVAGIAPGAVVAVLVPAPMWAQAAYVYLTHTAKLAPDLLAKLRFYVLPTDDIWVRDYGPFIGYDSGDHHNGARRVVVDAIYDHHPAYPQGRDDAMPRRWATHHGLPRLPLDLHIEGGNLLSDGAGTLFTTQRTLQANPGHDRDSLEAYLHTVFTYDRLIVTPRLPVENTGHIDLIMKPITRDRLLVSAPNGWGGGRLRDIGRYLRGLRSPDGAFYTVIDLPTPRPYLNWLMYPIFRSYTNALIVNGRVLVPVYGVPEDDVALRVYADALPEYTILPIDLITGINGGGAIHCMTREIPAATVGA